MSTKTKKKPTKKGATAKKRSSKKSKKHLIWWYLKLFLICGILAAFTYLGFAYIYKDSPKPEVKVEKPQISKPKPPAKEQPKKQEIKPIKKIPNPPEQDPKKDKIEPKIQAPEPPSQTEIKTPKIQIQMSEKIDYESKKPDENLTPAKQTTSQNDEKPNLSTKPKLVIIIDDVAFKHHVDAIKSINLKITPSFFPPTKHHPDTPKFARNFKFYMIHLPLEAKNFTSEEIDTLRTSDSYDTISKRIRQIKRDFPNLTYINNHTGSKFTSDFDAMDRLLMVIKQENLRFLDSRTIDTTKVEAAAKKNSLQYIVRDVFLDHEDNKKSITKQLQKAVEIAKKQGKAIAIGHPYKNTIDVLKNSSAILKGVEVVYLKDIF